MLSNLKLLVLGDSKVGKTAMMMTFSNGEYPRSYIPSIVDGTSLCYEYHDHKINIGFWDTAALPEYDTLRPLSYPQTDVIVLCFSAISPTSFTNITQKWIPEIEATLPNYKMDVPIILLATKIDMRDDPNTIELLKNDQSPGSQSTPISYEQGLALSKQINAAAYLECSSKLNIGVKEIFQQACHCLLYFKNGVLNDGDQIPNINNKTKNNNNLTTDEKTKDCIIM